MAFMANRILPKELVEHQEEFKDLPGILNYFKSNAEKLLVVSLSRELQDN